MRLPSFQTRPTMRRIWSEMFLKQENNTVWKLRQLSIIYFSRIIMILIVKTTGKFRGKSVTSQRNEYCFFSAMWLAFVRWRLMSDGNPKISSNWPALMSQLDKLQTWPALSCIFCTLSCKVTIHRFPKQYYSSQWSSITAWYIRCKMEGGTKYLTRFMAPIPETIFLVIFSMWQFQLSLSSVVISSDFVVATCFTRELFIKIEGEAATLARSHSVLVIFRVSLFAFNQVCTFNRSQ